MNRHTLKMIVFVLVLIVLMSVLLSVVLSMVGGAVESLSNSGGAKPVVEKLWCGKPACMGESK